MARREPSYELRKTRVKVVSTVIMTKTSSKMTDSDTHPASSVKKKLTNSHRCKAYRAALAKDPALFQQMKDNDKARARRNRQKPKSEEQINHEKQLHRERQKRYLEKQKQKQAKQAKGAIARPKTRLDKEKTAHQRQANNAAVQKHRMNQSAQKRRQVNEKRMVRYYQQKGKSRAALRAKTDKAVQAQLDFQSTDFPCPSERSFKRAGWRVRYYSE